MKAISGPLAVVLASGGLDSTVLAYNIAANGYTPLLLSIYYGQRHGREVEAAARIAECLGADHVVCGLPALGPLLSGSALTDDHVAVPHGHYAEESMRSTVVPNRNAILLSVAYGLAVARQAEVVAAAFHAGDHPIYPDCRPEFALAFSAMEQLATEGYTPRPVQLYVPFIHSSKAQIVRGGVQLDVPFEFTWSCYEGGERHCGKCGTCVERLEAFRLAGAVDPVEYATDYEGPRC